MIHVKRGTATKSSKKKIPSHLIDDCSSFGPTWYLATSQCNKDHGSARAYRILCENIVLVPGRAPLIMSTKWVAGSCTEHEICVEHQRRRENKYRVATCVVIETFTDMAMRAVSEKAIHEKEVSGYRSTEAVKHSLLRSPLAQPVSSLTLTKRTPFRRLPDCSTFGAHYNVFGSTCQPKVSSNAYKVLCVSARAGARSIRGDCYDDEVCYQFVRKIARCVNKRWLENAYKDAKNTGLGGRSRMRTIDHSSGTRTILDRRQLIKVSPAQVCRHTTPEPSKCYRFLGLRLYHRL